MTSLDSLGMILLKACNYGDTVFDTIDRVKGAAQRVQDLAVSKNMVVCVFDRQSLWVLDSVPFLASVFKGSPEVETKPLVITLKIDHAKTLARTLAPVTPGFFDVDDYDLLLEGLLATDRVPVVVFCQDECGVGAMGDSIEVLEEARRTARRRRIELN